MSDLLSEVIVELESFAQEQHKQLSEGLLGQLATQREYLRASALSNHELATVLKEAGKMSILIAESQIAGVEDFHRMKVSFGCPHAYDNCNCLVSAFLQRDFNIEES